MGSLEPFELAQQNRVFETASPEEIVRWAWEKFGGRLAFGTAFGSTGMVLLDVIQQTVPQIPVFTIDTGYLFQETLDLKSQLEARYGFEIESLHPRLSVSEQDRKFGGALFRHDPDRCCWMRKVEPLQRKLADLDGWMTSLRRDQSDTRKGIGILEAYRTHSGRSLVKVNPMANWTRKQVWDYILVHDVPYNPLLDQGYPSVGCWPCTQAVGNTDDERAGRWAGTAKTECGIHTFMGSVEPSDSPVQVETAAAAD
ncbi:MAG: phosphoadenylyl-sulfate reductase [bacterium]|nr:phosphoadenylyl-sulfate reductase [bacterium]